MALIKCEECGHMISDMSDVCPACGAPTERKVQCAECGTIMSASASICPNCGCPKSNSQNQSSTAVQRFVFVGTDYFGNLGKSGKNRVTFALFSFFCWWFGAQYFYIGKTGAGIINILCVFPGCFLFIPTLIILYFAISDGIKALLMTQEEFEENFVFSPKTYPV